MLSYNPGRECGTCENCWLRRLPTDMKIREVPVEFIYDLYCNVDDKSLGSMHNSKAELCRNYVERKEVTYGY